MKKYFTFLLMMVSGIPVFAQITVTDADMPVTGFMYIRDNAANTNIIDLTVTGANQTWDYSQLTALTTDTTQYVTVASTPLLYQLYFNNNIIYPDWKADLALPGNLPTIPGSPITISDVINYYKVTPTAFYQVGFGATINSAPASQRYDPRDKRLMLPNTFGLVDSNYFEWLFVVPVIGTYGQAKTRANETDGWGTLILPNGTFNTLRVKSIISGVDTFYIDLAGFGVAIASTQYEFNWYANGEGEPVLTVNANSIAGNLTINSASYKNITTNGIQQQPGPVAAIHVSPNPVSDKINLRYSNAGEEEISVLLYDISGREMLHEKRTVHAATVNDLTFDIGKFPAGYYTFQVISEKASASCKIVIY